MRHPISIAFLRQSGYCMSESGFIRKHDRRGIDVANVANYEVKQLGYGFLLGVIRDFRGSFSTSPN